MFTFYFFRFRFSFSFLLFPLFPLLIGPSLYVPLFACAHRQRSSGYVFAHGGSTADVGSFTDRDRRHEVRIAADEHVVLDSRLMLADAIVIARNGAGADVDVF